MAITSDDLHFRHFQSVPDGSIQVFVCLTGSTPDGKTIDGPLIEQNVQLSEPELLVAQAVIDRAKAAIVARLNAPPVV